MAGLNTLQKDPEVGAGKPSLRRTPGQPQYSREVVIRPPLEERTDTTRDEVQTSTNPLEAMRDFTDAQLIAVAAGFEGKQSAEAVNMSPKFRCVELTVPRHKASEARALVREHALICSDDFLGGDSRFATLTGLVPVCDETGDVRKVAELSTCGEIPNVIAIANACRERGINANISVAAAPTVLARVQSNTAIPLHSFGTQTHEDELNGVQMARVSPTRVTELRPTSSAKPIDVRKLCAARATTQGIASVGNETKNMPTAGLHSYIILPLDVLSSTISKSTGVQSLLQELGLHGESSDSIVRVYAGNLVIMTPAERAGSSFVNTGRRLQEAIPNSRILCGEGTVELVGDGNRFTLKGFPEKEIRDAILNHVDSPLAPGTYVTDHTNSRVTRPDNGRPRDRHSAVYHVTTSPAAHDLHRVNECVSRPARRQGGPDRVVGERQNKAKDELEAALADRRVRLIIVEGPATSAKSTIITFATAGTGVNPMFCTLDPACAHRHGEEVVTVADQVAQHAKDLRGIRETPRSGPQQPSDGVGTLLRFADRKAPFKIKQAQTDWQQVATYVTEAAVQLNEGRTPLILDDLHYLNGEADIRAIQQIAYGYLQRTRSGVVVIALRPGDMHSPQAVKDLESFFPGAVKRISLNSPVDLQKEPQAAHDYILGYLPPDKRRNQDGQAVTVDQEWCRKFAAVAKNQPLLMNKMVELAIEDPDANLFIEGNVIKLRPDVMQRILSEFQSSDMEACFLTQLQKLGDTPRVVLQCIALLRGHVSSKDLPALAAIGGLRTTSELRSSLDTLTSGNYLTEERKRPDSSAYSTQHDAVIPVAWKDDSCTYSIQHDALIPVVLKTISPEEKARLSLAIHNRFANRKDVPVDVRFDVAHMAASSNTIDPSDPLNLFWRDYADICGKCLDDAHGQSGRTYKLASMTRELAASRMAEETLRTVSPFQECPQSNALEHLLCTKVLWEQAESAIELGKFPEATEIIQLLSDIHRTNQAVMSTIANVPGRLALLRFNMAYIRSMNPTNGTEMKELKTEMASIYDNELVSAGMKPCELAEAEMKLAFRMGRLRPKTAGSVARDQRSIPEIFNETEADLRQDDQDHRRRHSRVPSRRWTECQRIRLRAEFDDTIRSDRLPGRFDDDVGFNPSVLDGNGTTRMLRLQGNLEQTIGEQRRTDKEPTTLLGQMARYPTSFGDMSALAVLEQVGSVNGMLGDFDRAAAYFAEAWRRANLMGKHPLAARAVRFLSDAQMMDAISILRTHPTAKEPGKLVPSGAIDAKRRAGIFNALHTLTERGEATLRSLEPQNEEQLLIRQKRIRAVSLAVLSYSKDLDSTGSIKPQKGDELKAALEGPIGTALADYQFLNTNHPTAGHEADVQYYVNGCMKPIISAARKLKLSCWGEDMLDAKKCPYMNPQFVEYGLRHIDRSPELTDCGLNEVDRKRASLEFVLAEARRVNPAPIEIPPPEVPDEPILPK